MSFPKTNLTNIHESIKYTMRWWYRRCAVLIYMRWSPSHCCHYLMASSVMHSAIDKIYRNLHILAKVREYIMCSVLRVLFMMSSHNGGRPIDRCEPQQSPNRIKTEKKSRVWVFYSCSRRRSGCCFIYPFKIDKLVGIMYVCVVYSWVKIRSQRTPGQTQRVSSFFSSFYFRSRLLPG